MSNWSPIFPMPHPQHFSDYGFDPEMDYFQVLDEARKHNRDSSRSIDSFRFKLQKPKSKDESRKPNKNKKRWWKHALFFFKRKWVARNNQYGGGEDVHRARARAFRESMSGPVYVTESRSGSSSPYRINSGPASGLVSAGNFVPYISLRELNMEQQRMSTSAMPTYLVT